MEIISENASFRNLGQQTRRQVSATDPNASWGVVISVDRFVRVEKEEVAEQGWDNFLI